MRIDLNLRLGKHFIQRPGAKQSLPFESQVET